MRAGDRMDGLINVLKQELYLLAELLRDNLADEMLKLDCLALIDAINVLEVRAYGHAITDVWGLVDGQATQNTNKRP